ncbi:endospore germination permease [Alkalihalobacterium chitinilyticum]|uniref:Spore germination protein n=1 Tax=Alkalihalobacterium chitinilyticum TaxID=2980103 RepID=A0ABT5VKX1_9BACI|nr:endospore germination permease [Alkalihalobacterium chitinilyticum]MDE5416096.1 spore germination protein [Alkalihalobacterium chitinilyticum]
MKNDEQIFRSFDIFAFTVCSTFGVGLVFLPFVSGEEIRSAWLKLIVGVIPYFILVYFIHRFVQKYESQNLFSESKKQLPKLIFYGIVIYFILSTLYSGIVVIKGMDTIVQTYLLPETPRWIIVGSFLLVVGAAAYYGVAAITRFVVFFVLFDVIILLFLVTLLLGEHFRWIYIPPVIAVDPVTFSLSTLSDTIRYAGVFALLAFVSHVKKKEKVLHSMNYGLIFVMVTYVILSLVAVGTFGFEESLALVSPFISLVQTFGGEAGGLERIDLFFVSFWIIAFYKMVIIHVWFMVYVARIAWPKIQPEKWVITYILILFIGIMATADFTNEPWRPYHVNTLIYSFILPMVLLCYFLFRKKRGRASHEG